MWGGLPPSGGVDIFCDLLLDLAALDDTFQGVKNTSMPMIWIPAEELRALQDVWTHAERVNWEAYDRVKVYILTPQEEEPVEQADEPVVP